MSTPAERERNRIRNQRWRAAHPERVKAQRKRWWNANIEKVRAQSRRWHAANQERAKAYYADHYAAHCERLKIEAVERFREKRYGLTPDGLKALVTSQNGCCAICGAKVVTSRQTHVDHDHKTGRTRGVLCRGCNCGLGNFRDDAALLRRAAEYLERHCFVLKEARP